MTNTTAPARQLPSREDILFEALSIYAEDLGEDCDPWNDALAVRADEIAHKLSASRLRRFLLSLLLR